MNRKRWERDEREERALIALKKAGFLTGLGSGGAGRGEVLGEVDVAHVAPAAAEVVRPVLDLRRQIGHHAAVHAAALVVADVRPASWGKRYRQSQWVWLIDSRPKSVRLKQPLPVPLKWRTPPSIVPSTELVPQTPLKTLISAGWSQQLQEFMRLSSKVIMCVSSWQETKSVFTLSVKKKKIRWLYYGFFFSHCDWAVKRKPLFWLWVNVWRYSGYKKVRKL